MHIESIKNERLLEKHDIIELKVRGKQEELDDFFMVIQDHFSLAHDEWDASLGMLTMTFDYVPKEQTMTRIKAYTREYIEQKRKERAQ